MPICRTLAATLLAVLVQCCLVMQAAHQAMGDDAPHADAAKSLADARTLIDKANYADAGLLLQELTKELKLSAPNSPHLAATLDLLGVLDTAVGNYPQAEQNLRSSAAIAKSLPDGGGAAYARTLTHLAHLLLRRGDYRPAGDAASESLAVLSRLKQNNGGDYAQALSVLAELRWTLGFRTEARGHFTRAIDLFRAASLEETAECAAAQSNLGLLYCTLDDLAKAESAIRRAMATREKVLGRQHPDYAHSLVCLSYLLKSQGKTNDIEGLLNEALEIRRNVLGEKHPDYAITFDRLANLYRAQGQYFRAEPMAQKAVDICATSLGRRHSTYASALNNLGLVYLAKADYVDAGQAFTTALSVFDGVLGPRHSYSLTVRHNLAELYEAEGDHAKARQTYTQLRDLRAQRAGGDRRDDALELTGLARVYQKQRDFKTAKELLQKALATLAAVPGAELEYATTLEELANLNRATHEYDAAYARLKKVLEIRRRRLGTEHPDYATALENYASLDQATGKYAEAEKWYRWVAALRKRTLGAQHPEYATALANLAGACRALEKKTAEAATHYRTALGIIRNHLNATAAAQSERQQLAMTQTARVYLDDYLSLVVGSPAERDEAYSEVLAWKGAVSRRQLTIRKMRRAIAEQSPEIAGLYAQLEAASARLAQQSHATPKKGEEQAHRRSLVELSESVERLQSELAAKSADFRKDLDSRSHAPDDVRQALPETVALIDLLEYWKIGPIAGGKKPAVPERRLLAFIVRRDHATELVDLGPAKTIEQAVNAWLNRLETPSEKDPGPRLRQLLWTPLEKYVDGVEIVLISPDGASAWFPWAALPGKEPGTFLIESLAFVTVPVPQMLPETLATDTHLAGDAPSLLVVGDIDYGAEPGKADVASTKRSAVRGDRADDRYRWQRLAASREEVLSVVDSFAQAFPDAPAPRSLRGKNATEEAVRSHAPKHRFLHLATHGFFAPPQAYTAERSLPSADAAPGERAARTLVAAIHPGLLSGIVLAGVNHPEALDQDDGILTATEVEQLDLSGVQLVTLSACQTGIGNTAGGEGLLGLQRAFQTAGASSILASLWKVDDRQTEMLMTAFYENLWKQKLSRAEALRQAQIEMLKTGAARGMTFSAKHPPGKDRRLPPYYWAAFVLSGDWR